MFEERIKISKSLSILVSVRKHYIKDKPCKKSAPRLMKYVAVVMMRRAEIGMKEELWTCGLKDFLAFLGRQAMLSCVGYSTHTWQVTIRGICSFHVEVDTL